MFVTPFFFFFFCSSESPSLITFPIIVGVDRVCVTHRYFIRHTARARDHNAKPTLKIIRAADVREAYKVDDDGDTETFPFFYGKSVVYSIYQTNVYGPRLFWPQLEHAQFGVCVNAFSNYARVSRLKNYMMHAWHVIGGQLDFVSILCYELSKE